MMRDPQGEGAEARAGLIRLFPPRLLDLLLRNQRLVRQARRMLMTAQVTTSIMRVTCLAEPVAILRQRLGRGSHLVEH